MSSQPQASKDTGAEGKSSHTRRGRPRLRATAASGQSLMLPIAVLPAAGILLRLGQDDLLGRIDAPLSSVRSSRR